MKILTDNFYKFLFGFIGVVLVSLILIFIAGFFGNQTEVFPDRNVAGDCIEGETC